MKSKNNIKKSRLTYKNGVVAVIFDEENNFLIVQLVSHDKDQWNFIGGVKEKSDKTNVGNVFRELREKLGIEKEDFRIIEMSKYPFKYDFPENIVQQEIKQGKYFKGEKKDVFVVEFIGNKRNIKIDKDKIKKIKWVKFKDLKKYLVFPNQYDHFLKVIQEIIPQTINPNKKSNTDVAKKQLS